MEAEKKNVISVDRRKTNGHRVCMCVCGDGPWLLMHAFHTVSNDQCLICESQKSPTYRFQQPAHDEYKSDVHLLMPIACAYFDCFHRFNGIEMDWCVRAALDSISLCVRLECMQLFSSLKTTMINATRLTSYGACNAKPSFVFTRI